MKKINYLFLSIFLLIIIPLVSSNGLYIQNNTININKTNGVDFYFNIGITNQETFTFYNVSSQNSIISFDKFDLSSGQTKTIQAKVSSNSDFDGQVKIISDYFANLGTSNETEEITIDSSGLDLCNLDLIVGDSIIWTNTFSGEVKLKNLNSGDYFATISGTSDYTEHFSESKEFNYQVFKTGLPFSSICHLNIRPENGYIHSSEYDAPINLNVKILYEPTTISTYFPITSYTLDYNSEKEDLFTITNTGTEIAKSVKLSEEWFTFDENNFDLSIGESKNIGYTIRPLIYQTNQTNKTYNKSVKIEGNFNTINRGIDVFINYKDLSGIYGNSSYDKEYLKNLVNFFCSIFPNECPTQYLYENESNRNVTFTINEETYRDGILAEDLFREEIRDIMNLQNEKLSSIDNNSMIYLNNANETSEEIENQSKKLDNLLGTITFGAIIFLIISIVIGMCYILFNQKAQIKVRKLFHKGEKY